MISYPKIISDLIDAFKKLPGVGEKSAERMTFSIIKNFTEEEVEVFSEALKKVKKDLKKCGDCNNLTEKELCEICLDNKRNKRTLCIVENIKDINLFEKGRIFDGKYYVLDNVISPSKGVGPEDINIEKLLKMIRKNNVEEIIFALKQNIESETTLLYIAKILEKEKLVFSKMAQGIPLGVDIEYLDNLTLEMAFNDRKRIF